MATDKGWRRIGECLRYEAGCFVADVYPKQLKYDVDIEIQYSRTTVSWGRQFTTEEDA